MSMQMSETDFGESTRVTPRNFVDVLARIDREIGAIDKELRQIHASVEQDLRDLYETNISKKFGNKALDSFDTFKEKHHDRLIEVKSHSLKKAKSELNELKAEILRAR